MKVELFGGTFNPPTWGHKIIAQQLRDFSGCDEVWLLPNYGQNPPKPGVAPCEDRLIMTKMLEGPGIKVCDLEIVHRLSGKTIELLPFLPGGNIYEFVIGSDQLATFHLWGEYEKLLEHMPFLVFPRYGYPNEPLYKNMRVLNDPRLISSNISSTIVRDRVAQGLPIDDFVLPSIANHIYERGLYKR